MLIGNSRQIGFAIIVVMVACQNNSNNKLISTDSIPNNYYSSEDSGQIFKDTIALPININEIKKRFSKYSTSGVLPSNERKRYPTANSNGFLGFYQLFEGAEQTEIKFIGELIVHVNGTPEKWRYDNTDETFISIRLHSGNILVWNRLGIGSSESDVLKFINGNFHYKKGSTLYSEIGDFSIEFIITDGTVKELEVRKMFKTK
jgi:hypothetical protein